MDIRLCGGGVESVTRTDVYYINTTETFYSASLQHAVYAEDASTSSATYIISNVDCIGESGEMSYTIDTNLPSDQIPDDFLPGMSEFLCTLFNRPRKVTMGQLRADQVFDFKGSTDPCAVMHVIRGFQNPSKLNEELIERFVAAISEHIESKLGIPKSRLMIFYYQNDLALIANDGKTLKRIWSDIGTFPPSE